MGHRLLEDPLVPGMAPTATRLLAVGGDTAKLGRLVTNLRLRGYQVTSSTDPAAAMAGLRQDGPQSFNFDLVMVDTEIPGGARAATNKLFEFAVREPLLCAYAIRGEGTFGPLAMEDLDKFMKPIYTVESNGPNSPKPSLNGPYNTSPSTTTSTITNLSFSGRRTGRRSKKRTHGTGSQEVEQAQNPKKPRVVWTDELCKEFLEAYNKLVAAGEDPVPKKILHVMNNPTLTREHIASHLQKHRLKLKEACTDPLRTSHSGTERHISARKASFPSRNKASRQQASPIIMQPDMSTTVYINYGMNAHTMLEASTKRDTQDSRVVIHMQTFKSTDKSNRTWHPCNYLIVVAYFPNCMLRVSFKCNNEPKPSWDTEFLFSSGD
ncbi:hypothetical protein ACQ4PT_020647 [Festuca glaucescens]